jgi:hypothetical protein
MFGLLLDELGANREFLDTRLTPEETAAKLAALRAEAPGILDWLVEGARRARERSGPS